MKKTNNKEINSKKEEHYTEKQLKCVIIADKRAQKELKKLENSNNNLNEQVEVDATVRITQISRKIQPELIENNQDFEQSEKVKLISVDPGLDDIRENLQKVRKVFNEIDSQFQSKMIQKQKRIQNYDNNQQQFYKEWLMKKSNKWNELLKEKIVREYNDSKLLKSSNIQKQSTKKNLNSLNNKIRKWEREQLELIFQITKLMLNFYTRTMYNKKSYKKIIASASQTILNVFQNRIDINKKRREEYVKALKYNLYRVGVNYLKYFNTENCVSNFELWVEFKTYFQDILNTEEINFLTFRLEDESLDFQMRYMFLETSFYYFIRNCKIKQQTKTSAKSIEYNIKDLTQLSIKKSHIYYYESDIKRLEKLVQVVKNSWFIRFHLAYYIRERKQYLKNNKLENEKQIKRIGNQRQQQKQEAQYKEEQEEENYQQTFEKIVKFINKTQVIFIDSMTLINGITLTPSQDYKQYPIFINLFIFFQKRVIDFGFFESFTFFVLIHELAHSVIKNGDFLTKTDSSNHQNIDEDKKMDGGWLFQYLIFGKSNEVFSSTDYQQVMGLLKLKQCPTYLFNKPPKNKQSYEKFIEDKQKYLQTKQKNLSDCQSYERLQQLKKNTYSEEQIKEQLKKLEEYMIKNKKQVFYGNKQEKKNKQPEIQQEQLPTKKQVLKMIQTISSFGKRNPNQNHYFHNIF